MAAIMGVTMTLALRAMGWIRAAQRPGAAGVARRA